MGHVPSRELCAEPFAMDISSKNTPERLVAVALTKYYFPSVDDPLFQKFCQVRGESHVRNWYWRPTGISLDVLPPCPSDAQIFEYYVEDATKVVDADLPPSKFTTLPVMVVKMNDADSTEYPDATNCVVVGTIGSRNFQFSVPGDADEQGNEPTRRLAAPGMEQKKKELSFNERGLTQFFMSNPFYNEVKSICLFRLAHACYKHFCQKAGLATPPWGHATGVECFQSNLPLMRLTHQLNFIVHEHEAWIDDGLICIEHGERVYLGVEGVSMATGAEGLADSVEKVRPEDLRPSRGGRGPKRSQAQPQSHTTKPRFICEHRIKIGASDVQGTEPSLPLTRKLAHLEAIMERAKLMWREVNRAVAVHQVPKKKKAASASTTSQPTSEEETPSALSSLANDASSSLEKRSTSLPLDNLTLEELVPRSNGKLGSVFTFDAVALRERAQPTPPAAQSPNGAGVPPFPEGSPGRPDSADEGVRVVPELEVLPKDPVVSRDPRVFLGDRTPVTIRTMFEQWVPKFWRAPLQPLVRANWQPHLAHGFVAYSIDHTTLLVYDQSWYPEVLLGCSPFIFLETGETLYTVTPKGQYVSSVAA